MEFWSSTRSFTWKTTWAIVHMPRGCQQIPLRATYDKSLRSIVYCPSGVKWYATSRLASSQFWSLVGVRFDCLLNLIRFRSISFLGDWQKAPRELASDLSFTQWQPKPEPSCSTWARQISSASTPARRVSLCWCIWFRRCRDCCNPLCCTSKTLKSRLWRKSPKRIERTRSDWKRTCRRLWRTLRRKIVWFWLASRTLLGCVGS